MTPKFKKSESGFFSINFLFFVSLISVTLMSYGYVFYAQKQKDQFRKVCYFDLVDIQKNMVASEKQLFLLNPESTALRVRLNILYIELAAATASYNYPLAAKLAVDIQTTLNLQSKLDTLQKSIIQAANYRAKIQVMKLHQELVKNYALEKRLWTSLVKENRQFYLTVDPSLAVRPDSIGGTAPNYELKNNYQRLQALELNLQYQFTNRKETQTLLNTKQNFQFSCQVSFSKKDHQWDLKINQDKHLSKL